jgi:hypothetical protein
MARGSPFTCGGALRCIFFSPHPSNAIAKGQCRLGGPTLDMAPTGPRTIWPLVRKDDFCGEHAVWADEPAE